MAPFSSVISFLSGVLGSRRLAIVDDLGLPRGVLSRYDSYKRTLRENQFLTVFERPTTFLLQETDCVDSETPT